MSSWEASWPIVCFFAKMWIAMSKAYCSFANLV